uniref:Uncharacterized protein n=1 Tax=Anopheles atroparvus TaxID=41427 RepID=A0AAG5DPD3_ANOAO
MLEMGFFLLYFSSECVGPGASNGFSHKVKPILNSRILATSKWMHMNRDD